MAAAEFTAQDIINTQTNAKIEILEQEIKYLKEEMRDLKEEVRLQNVIRQPINCKKEQDGYDFSDIVTMIVVGMMIITSVVFSAVMIWAVISK